MIIGIDFDGTCVTHEFPNIGKDVGSIQVLKKIIDKGHQLILFTMRSDVINAPSPEIKGNFTGAFLTDAVQWFTDNNIPLFGIQTNPTQLEWTTSPKAYCHLYIDDCGLGCPLKFDENYAERPFVDWIEVEKILIERGIL